MAFAAPPLRQRMSLKVPEGQTCRRAESVGSIDRLVPSSLPPIYHEYYKAITTGPYSRKGAGVANAKRAFAFRIIGLWSRVGKPVSGGIGAHPGSWGPRRAGVHSTRRAAAKRKRQERVEQLKLEILTAAETLNDAKSRAEEMQKENESLGKAYEALVKAANDDSAVLLNKATEQEMEMRKLHRKNRRNRRQYRQGIEALKNELEGKCEVLRQTFMKKKKEFETAVEECRRMRTFKERAQNEPHVLAAEIQGWKSEVAKYQKKADAEIELAMSKYEEEVKEIEKRTAAQLAEFFATVNLDETGAIYRVLRKEMTRGARLRQELAVLDEHTKRAVKEIGQLVQRRAKLRVEVDRLKRDRRRDVLRLPEVMTCKPEDEFGFGGSAEHQPRACLGPS